MFKEPTDVFLNTGPLSFSVPVTLTLEDGCDRVINAIFDSPWLDTQAGEAVQDARAPMITARESDVAGLVRGGMVRINDGGCGRNYSVIEIRPDGTGWAFVMLAPES